MDESLIHVKIGYDKKFPYRLYMLFRNIFKIGFTRTLKKISRSLFFKIKGIDFSPQELEKLDIVECNKDRGVTYVATNFDVLADVILYIIKVHTIRYKEHSDIFSGAFLDYGCGKGRVLYIAKKLGFNSVIGVEFCKDIYNIANTNLEKLFPLSCEGGGQIDTVLDDATNIKPSKDAVVIFFYNPFDEFVMDKVIKNIISVEYVIRPYIIYVNPILRDMFLKSSFDMVSTIINDGTGDIVDVYRLSKNEH